ncbi:DUF3450 domain-containing protein [Agaribacter marinus]|uniref:DUF3450 domain-containing protein n=1 Tax=Agaribacter marinus TaxID=1431249 RepID=A0AA37SY53_9ALTE|nr:DUF3450 domain-containing protein [Agaribacter marinus]GLR71167.1 DUF3450 domain-containing protein [Agaribacter marinus]
MKVLAPLGAILLTGVLSFSAIAQEDQYLDSANEIATEINASAETTQNKIDGISEQIGSKLQQYKALLKEIEGLDVYNGQLKKQIGNQEQEMLDLNAAIDEVSVVERQITPLMINMIEGLGQFIKLDMPFLPEERANRVADLNNLMDQASVAPSEKFRRVMEAFQIEMDYGRTIESYGGLIDIDGDETAVDFLRIGRTALLYQTRDQSRQGVWNKQTRQWEELESSYRTQVTKALRIAKKQLAPDLLMVPVAITD